MIGREHTTEEMEKFAKEKKLSLSMAPDPKREIYGKYAEKYIPRNFIVGKDGKIKLASVGYSETSFQEIVQTLEKELKQPSPSDRASAASAGPCAWRGEKSSVVGGMRQADMKRVSPEAGSRPDRCKIMLF